MTQHLSIKKHNSVVHKEKIGYREMLNNLKILFKNNQKYDLTLAEALLIKKHNPPLNSQEEGSTRILKIF